MTSTSPLRQIWSRAWHDWRDSVLCGDGDYSIPYSGDDLLDLLITDLERETALAAGSRRVKTAEQAECEASQSGGEAVTPKGHP